ncbi:MAG TPA: bis(5'-nucleosyl)-tetraphosphatase (symmetrical) YqeK [Anaerolineae bacterium]|nr:bis(5'-nucleosyl)-tetraphosphatase (symmetrical) YqeK [Anaerolineae bacterium]
MSYNTESIKEKLKKRLKPQHYEHSLRTAETAAQMARAFGMDDEKAYIAGLLHDYAKSMDGEELISQAEKLGIKVDPVDIAFPYLLHAQVGARLVELELNIKNKEIIASIANHTIGSPSMSQFDKIIYVADMIEPGRSYQGLGALRRIAFDDLDEVFREAYAHSLMYIIDSRKLIHPLTVDVWNRLVVLQQNG